MATATDEASHREEAMTALPATFHGVGLGTTPSSTQRDPRALSAALIIAWGVLGSALAPVPLPLPGAPPLMRPIQHHTWDTFSRTWEVDVRQVFHWIREALLLPLAPRSTVIALSSAAALGRPPLSGGSR